MKKNPDPKPCQSCGKLMLYSAEGYRQPAYFKRRKYCSQKCFIYDFNKKRTREVRVGTVVGEYEAIRLVGSYGKYVSSLRWEWKRTCGHVVKDKLTGIEDRIRTKKRCITCMPTLRELPRCKVCGKQFESIYSINCKKVKSTCSKSCFRALASQLKLRPVLLCGVSVSQADLASILGVSTRTVQSYISKKTNSFLNKVYGVEQIERVKKKRRKHNSPVMPHNCVACGKTLARRPGEKPYRFESRKTCGPGCTTELLKRPRRHDAGAA